VEQADRDRGRALVIDDNPAVRQLVCEFLRIFGFDAQAAAGGLEGLARWERESFALVVTDLSMPEMSGWEVIETVRRLNSDIPVILMSGSASSLDAQRARDSRVALLTKPFRLEDFRAAVTAATEATATPLRETPAAAEVSRSAEPSGDVLDRAQAASQTLRQAGTWLATICEAMQTMLDEHQAWREQLTVMQEEHRALRGAHAALACAHESMARTIGSLQAERDGTRRLLSEIRGVLDAHLQRLGR
jgi:CheY-like chemotaxis protein